MPWPSPCRPYCAGRICAADEEAVGEGAKARRHPRPPYLLSEPVQHYGIFNAKASPNGMSELLPLAAVRRHC